LRGKKWVSSVNFVPGEEKTSGFGPIFHIRRRRFVLKNESK
jgi:hypothetical protein